MHKTSSLCVIVEIPTVQCERKMLECYSSERCYFGVEAQKFRDICSAAECLRQHDKEQTDRVATVALEKWFVAVWARILLHSDFIPALCNLKRCPNTYSLTRL
jgi:hypothetical protein